MTWAGVQARLLGLDLDVRVAAPGCLPGSGLDLRLGEVRHAIATPTVPVLPSDTAASGMLRSGRPTSR